MLKYAYKVLKRKIKTIINYEVSKSYSSSFYDGRRLYQYNKDDFFIEVLIVNKLFLNYKFTRN